MGCIIYRSTIVVGQSVCLSVYSESAHLDAIALCLYYSTPSACMSHVEQSSLPMILVLLSACMSDHAFKAKL